MSQPVKNDISIKNTVDTLMQWSEAIVNVVHRGNRAPSRSSSVMRDEEGKDFGQIRVKRSIDLAASREIAKYIPIANEGADYFKDVVVATYRNINAFYRIAGVFDSHKTKIDGCVVGNCHELAECMMVVIIKGFDKIRAPMICEIIAIPDAEDTLGTKVKNDRHVLVRIKYPDDPSVVIADAWSKDVYAINENGEELSEISKNSSGVARAARNLYKNHNHEAQVIASWDSETGNLIYKIPDNVDGKTITLSRYKVDDTIKEIEKRYSNVWGFIDKNIPKVELALK